nr:EAL domain-containing protein [Crocosphaera watsonii]
MLLENALREALKKKEFYLLYQPQIEMLSHRCLGIEALLRWHHPELGVVSPAQFIPIAEQSGLIQEIGTWVLTTACRQAKIWLEQKLDFGRIAVNVAAPQIQHGDFIQVVENVLKTTGLPAAYLELELTEGLLMKQTEQNIKQLEKLQGMGIKLTIDDFGIGYSSLNYLKRLPIDKLKIDQSFIRDLPHDTNDTAISQAVIALGYALNLQIIAEGVENEEQAAFLKEKGCHQAQGYFFSQPIPPQQVSALFA